MGRDVGGVCCGLFQGAIPEFVSGNEESNKIVT
jgi:hypothetical protein